MVSLALNVAAFLFLAWLAIIVICIVLKILGYLFSKLEKLESEARKEFKKHPANAVNR